MNNTDIGRCRFEPFLDDFIIFSDPYLVLPQSTEKIDIRLRVKENGTYLQTLSSSLSLIEYYI